MQGHCDAEEKPVFLCLSPLGRGRVAAGPEDLVAIGDALHQPLRGQGLGGPLHALPLQREGDRVQE
jgi:hypothetical protein